MTPILRFPELNVQNYGALPGTDITSVLYQLLDLSGAMGGAEWFFPPGVYYTTAVLLYDKLKIRGIPGASILRAKAGTDTRILKHKTDDGDGVLNWLSLEGMIFDGNVANQPKVIPATAIELEDVRFFSARDCVFQNASGYGLGMQAGTDQVAGTQEDVYIENCQFLDNGSGVGDYDGVDIKYVRRATILNCHAKGNANKGIDVRGLEVLIANCTATNNGTFGFGAGDNTLRAENYPSDIAMTSCRAEGNGKDGVVIYQGAKTNGRSGRVTLRDAVIRNNVECGVNLNSATSAATVHISGGEISGNGSHGVNIENVGKFRAEAVDIENNVGSGIKTKASGIYVGAAASLSGNGRYGIENASGATGHSIDPSVVRLGNTLGPVG